VESKQNFKIRWDKNEKIVKAQAFGELDETAALGILEQTERMAQQHGDKINWIIDLSQMTKATSNARKILAKVSGHPSIHKYAFFGASIFIRTVANFIISSAGQKNTKHFATEEEALKWIKEE
jgi:hypothetical protein